jgi:hypothetical protein
LAIVVAIVYKRRKHIPKSPSVGIISTSNGNNTTLEISPDSLKIQDQNGKTQFGSVFQAQLAV